MQEPEYDRRQAAREWARRMAIADIEYNLYAALRDGLGLWLNDAHVPAGFYGRDWPAGV